MEGSGECQPGRRFAQRSNPPNESKNEMNVSPLRKGQKMLKLGFLNEPHVPFAMFVVLAISIVAICNGSRWPLIWGILGTHVALGRVFYDVGVFVGKNLP